MIKEPGQTTGNAEILITQIENCRFAYTINNEQPVRCNWISDQPLFFSDCDVTEEEEVLDDPIFKALEKDILSLRQKTDAYDRLSAEFAEPSEAKSEKFKLDAEFMTAPYKAAPSADIAKLLKNSRFASMLLSFAELHGVEIKESQQILDASYDRDARLILIRSDLEEGTKILLAARELRRVWQHRNGAGLHPLMLHPDHAVVINRAQIADQSIAMIRTAWELQLANEKDAWTRVENSTMADLGRAFAREAVSDFRSINNGKAALTCFEAWFLSERCRKSDRTLIQQMLADYQGYVFAENAEASRSITFDLLNALGKMPFGENYLRSSAQMILNDTIFTEVRDRSNANFLWFIKFERSFKDAEEEISTESAKKTRASAVSETKLKATEAKNSAQIISLPVHAVPAPTRKAASGNGRDAEIVLFQPPVA